MYKEINMKAALEKLNDIQFKVHQRKIIVSWQLNSQEHVSKKMLWLCNANALVSSQITVFREVQSLCWSIHAPLRQRSLWVLEN